jgi:hypothetical protein
MMRHISFPLTAIAWVIQAVPCSAEPWFTDLEAEAPGLPWLYEGIITTVTEASATFLVLETYRGNALPGDTVSVEYWEMGTYLWTTLNPGDRLLLIPDADGGLQITGTYSDGFWSLSGFYDCNGFIVQPGVVTSEGIHLLLHRELLPPEAVEIDIRFPGSEEVLRLTVLETSTGWSVTSSDPRIGGLELETWDIELGGGMRSLLEPPVILVLGAGSGMTAELLGGVDSFHEGVYRCTAWPAAPVLIDPANLVEHLSGNAAEGVRELPFELAGLLPGDLGLPQEPSLSIDSFGELVLNGAEGPLPLYVTTMEGERARPVLGFGLTGAEDRMIYMDFSGLPDGPSGHLATDIVDALSAGPVSGSIWVQGMQDSGTFMIRSWR